MANDSNTHFLKDIQMANMHIKGYSTSSATRDMQIKTTTRHHFTPN